MLILCANVGSTSFKYQIIDVQTSVSLVTGGVERVGNSPSPFTHAVPGKPTVSGEIDAPNHNAAIVHAIDLITAPETGVMADLGDLTGIGFKTILARGIWRSALITNEVVDALEADIPFAPTHNPAYIASIRAFQQRLPEHTISRCF